MQVCCFGNFCLGDKENSQLNLHTIERLTASAAKTPSKLDDSSSMHNISIEQSNETRRTQRITQDTLSVLVSRLHLI